MSLLYMHSCAPRRTNHRFFHALRRSPFFCRYPLLSATLSPRGPDPDPDPDPRALVLVLSALVRTGTRSNARWARPPGACARAYEPGGEGRGAAPAPAAPPRELASDSSASDAPRASSVSEMLCRGSCCCCWWWCWCEGRDGGGWR